LTLPELENNPLKDRIARLMTVDMGEIIDFRLFVETISLFNEKVEKDEKFRFFFRLYDVDNDGFVGESELLFVFKTLAGHEYNDDELQGIVDQLIFQFDSDGDGRLNYLEFVNVFSHPEMEFL
jgi:serine/threonine-protein phosphatase 2B regulatory subunit